MGVLHPHLALLLTEEILEAQVLVILEALLAGTVGQEEGVNRPLREMAPQEGQMGQMVLAVQLGVVREPLPVSSGSQVATSILAVAVLVVQAAVLAEPVEEVKEMVDMPHFMEVEVEACWEED